MKKYTLIFLLVIFVCSFSNILYGNEDVQEKTLKLYGRVTVAKAKGWNCVGLFSVNDSHTPIKTSAIDADGNYEIEISMPADMVYDDYQKWWIVVIVFYNDEDMSTRSDRMKLMYYQSSGDAELRAQQKKYKIKNGMSEYRYNY